MSDIAEGEARRPSASSAAGRAPANAGSAWPACSPCSPWAGAALTGATPPDEEEAPPERLSLIHISEPTRLALI
eukprot:4609434-Alexandrium_andersonii.AAC.1